MSRSFYPTRHAVGKMAARCIDWSEVLWVLENPEVSYQNNNGAHADKDATINQRGTLYAVVANNPTFDNLDTAKEHPMYAVITVGLRRTQTWTNEDARARERGKP